MQLPRQGWTGPAACWNDCSAQQSSASRRGEHYHPPVACSLKLYRLLCHTKRVVLQVQLGELERFFRYCSGLRERRPLPQRHYFRTVLDVTGGGGWLPGCLPACLGYLRLHLICVLVMLIVSQRASA
jgi:hypothetical protein